jgi:UDP-N-acetylmuramoylalanine--D-glutamate ligase
MYTGGEKSILISGDLPEGTQVHYTNNKGIQPGEYNAVVTLTNPNYNIKTLSATLTIYNVLDTAKKTIDTILDRPDPWSFMPEAFSKVSLANTTNPIKDFSNFVNVSDINKKFIGKQMYVLWEGVDGMDTLLEKFDVVYAIGETIATAYQSFINDNPDDYAEWTGNVAGFNIKIVLNGKQSKMLVGNNVFSLELFADTGEDVNKGRIEIAQGGILNYEMRENYLKFNVALTIKGVLVMKQIEFVRNDVGDVAGYFYEYAGLESVAVKTSAVICFNEDYAIVSSAKRESEDLLIALELSNFQLLGIENFAPDVSVVCNLAPDHLDYMGSLDAYYASKMRIYENCSADQYFLRNVDDEMVMQYAQNIPCQVIDFSLVKTDVDLCVKDGKVYYQDVCLFERKNLKLAGDYNLCNAMISACMAYCMGVSLEDIQEVIATFKGVEHRLEYLGEKDGVRFYNDSKATNTHAAAAALSSFDKGIVLLAGGYDKGISFDDLKQYQSNVKKCIAFGQTKEMFKEIFDDVDLKETMKEAFDTALTYAIDGDVVLLSPACASYDQFKSYEERGHIFKQYVEEYLSEGETA